VSTQKTGGKFYVRSWQGVNRRKKVENSCSSQRQLRTIFRFLKTPAFLYIQKAAIIFGKSKATVVVCCIPWTGTIARRMEKEACKTKSKSQSAVALEISYATMRTTTTFCLALEGIVRGEGVCKKAK